MSQTSSETANNTKENQGFISINHRIAPASEAHISPFDRGFMFGDAVFEVIVAFGAKIIHLFEHLQRLRFSAAEVCLEIPWTDEELAFELQALCDLTRAPKTYLRLVVTRGDGLGISLTGSLKPNLVIYALPVRQEDPKKYTQGLRLKRVLSSQNRRGPQPKIPFYLPAIVANARASTEEFDEILWSRDDGELTEAATANLFLLARTGDLLEVITPPAHCGLLLGIVRQEVIRLLNSAQIPVQEQSVYAEEIPRFDEAFLTSTIKGLVPVQSIDRHRLHTTREGSSFKHINRLFNTWVQTQVGHPVDWSTGHSLSHSLATKKI